MKDTVDITVNVENEIFSEGANALKQLDRVLERAPAAVGAVQVHLQRLSNPGSRWPVVAEVAVDLDGDPVRARARAATAGEAVALLRDRLAGRLGGGTARRDQQPARASDAATSHTPSDFYYRPIEDREIRPHRPAAATPRTVAEAIDDLEEADYGFRLFTEATTKRDAIVYRSGEVHHLEHVGPTMAQSAVPTTVVVTESAPRLNLAEAKQRLDTSEARFIFFADAERGRGAVLHRRYDGHYGLMQAKV